MTTIRRTLSPVPRPGTLLGGEVVSTVSPLSKCSSCNQDYTPSSGSVSSSPFVSPDYVFYRLQSFILSLFSKRTSRPLERQKLRPNVWRRSLFHFFVCFLVGVFVGFTPFASVKTTTNILSKSQAFSFDHVTLDNHTKATNGTFLSSWVQDSEMGLENLLILVTPTYPRTFQAYHLNRLVHTLKLVKPPLLWVVVEMARQSPETAEVLRRSGVMYRHLVCTKNLTEVKDSRVHQRNVALSHIETHRLDGIVYFVDDTNVYSTEVFEHMRGIRRLGVWPIAKLKTGTRFATVVGPVCNGSQVIGWHTNDVMRRFRRFHAEFSGFAFNSTILWDPKRWHRPTLEPIRQLDTVKDGFQVSTFIEQVVEDESEMEGVPEDCSKVLAWNLPLESSHSDRREWFSKTNVDAIFPL